jgi:hypothetical protein
LLNVDGASLSRVSGNYVRCVLLLLLLLLHDVGDSIVEVLVGYLHVTNHKAECRKIYDVFRRLRLQEGFLLGHRHNLQNFDQPLDAMNKGMVVRWQSLF